MMDKDMLKRIKTAGMYQKKAIKALIPENMNSHLEVIEGEIKAMITEAAVDIFMDCKESKGCDDEGKKDNAKSKKVEIL
ncbi:MAG: hypothetical protein IIV45_17925 [Lachnospiraceae bacterium]|nr:hypothetical protein [Lachnospiraceae bacterium]MEE1009246.1 hypothetical protein [Agathobacter sp.]